MPYPHLWSLWTKIKVGQQKENIEGRRNFFILSTLKLPSPQLWRLWTGIKARDQVEQIVSSHWSPVFTALGKTFLSLVWLKGIVSRDFRRKRFLLENFELKILYENVHKEKNKHAADILGTYALSIKIICIPRKILWDYPFNTILEHWVAWKNLAL